MTMPLRDCPDAHRFDEDPGCPPSCRYASACFGERDGICLEREHREDRRRDAYDLRSRIVEDFNEEEERP